MIQLFRFLENYLTLVFVKKQTGVAWSSVSFNYEHMFFFNFADLIYILPIRDFWQELTELWKIFLEKSPSDRKY